MDGKLNGLEYVQGALSPSPEVWGFDLKERKVGAEWRQLEEQEEQRLLEELEKEMTVEERLELHRKLFPIVKQRAKKHIA